MALSRRLIGPAIMSLLIVLGACSSMNHTEKPMPTKASPRAQLDIGYSLLYQEANGIPKLDWLLKFKDKSKDMAKLTSDMVDYYQGLALKMEMLSKQFPAMRIDVEPMSQIEGETRKAMGKDQAKDMAPLIGKTGPEFERETLLMFYNALDEQRHLVGVMIGLETNSNLRSFLESTKTSLDAHHAKVGELLNRRYFSHG